MTIVLLELREMEPVPVAFASQMNLVLSCLSRSLLAQRLLSTFPGDGLNHPTGLSNRFRVAATVKSSKINLNYTLSCFLAINKIPFKSKEASK